MLGYCQILPSDNVLTRTCYLHWGGQPAGPSLAAPNPRPVLLLRKLISKGRASETLLVEGLRVSVLDGRIHSSGGYCIRIRCDESQMDSR